MPKYTQVYVLDAFMEAANLLGQVREGRKLEFMPRLQILAWPDSERTGLRVGTE